MKYFLSLTLLIVAVVCEAQVPQTLSYQGLLTDASGNPLSGTHTVLFNFYTAATGGTSAFSRGPLTVTTFQGLFTAIIGNGQGSNNGGIPTLGSTPYYLGIIADGGAELSPRVTLTAVPYAFTASSLDANATVNGAQVGTGINAANITTGTLPAAQIAVGSIDNTKLATGIDATKITVGTLNVARLPNTANSILDLSGAAAATSALNLPSNTASSRPSAPVAGALRYNSSESVLEYYNGSNWFFVAPKVLVIKDKQASGTSSGTSTTTWQDRNLNTLEGDNSVLVGSLSSNKFTLSPGEYIIEAWVPAYSGITNHKARLYSNSPTTNVILADGSSEYCSTSVSSNSHILTKITLSANTVLEIQQMCGVATANGTGPYDSFGSDSEVWTQVIITKLRGQ